MQYYLSIAVTIFFFQLSNTMFDYPVPKTIMRYSNAGQYTLNADLQREVVGAILKFDHKEIQQMNMSTDQINGYYVPSLFPDASIALPDLLLMTSLDAIQNRKAKKSCC